MAGSRITTEQGNDARKPTTRIQAPQGWVPVDLPELWRHRSLLFYLVMRDIRVIFARTHLGVVWILVPPLVTAALMTIVLGILARVPTGDLPYPLIVLSGMVPWLYFSNTVSKSTSSMTANAYLLTKVYFPRLIIPIVPVLVELVTLIVLSLVLLVALFYFGIPPRSGWLVVPGILVLAITLAIGAALWFSALNVKYPDIGNFVPIALQVLAYASPIFYPHSLIPAKWHWLYDLNPMVGVVETIRWGLFSAGEIPQYALSISVMATIAIVSTGVFVFRHIEDTAADLV